ncbi:unnamed protein product [Acanthosepion pharaonis]|uniref:Uncharacterized protein n=1 Tax=Acanthosepion pharaonis TaxID=158019 RepID=A0A812DJN2_ACAPH|nr:unnamed protein product [Sepia pharaonis]
MYSSLPAITSIHTKKFMASIPSLLSLSPLSLSSLFLLSLSLSSLFLSPSLSLSFSLSLSLSLSLLDFFFRLYFHSMPHSACYCIIQQVVQIPVRSVLHNCLRQDFCHDVDLSLSWPEGLILSLLPPSSGHCISSSVFRNQHAPTPFSTRVFLFSRFPFPTSHDSFRNFYRCRYFIQVPGAD